jgi:hypothetical protein
MEIMSKAPERWARNDRDDKNKNHGETILSWIPPDGSSGIIIEKTIFESLLKRIEDEWGILFEGDDDIRPIFTVASNESEMRFDFEQLTRCLFQLLEKKGKLPQDGPGESVQERRDTLMQKARTAITEVLGQTAQAQQVGPETKLGKIGSLFQRIRIYKKIENSFNSFSPVPHTKVDFYICLPASLLAGTAISWILASYIWSGLFIPLAFLFFIIFSFFFVSIFVETGITDVIDAIVTRNRIPTLGQYIQKVASRKHDWDREEKITDILRAQLSPILEPHKIDLSSRTLFGEYHDGDFSSLSHDQENHLK